jgi:hypothetical protein
VELIYKIIDAAMIAHSFLSIFSLQTPAIIPARCEIVIL